MIIAINFEYAYMMKFFHHYILYFNCLSIQKYLYCDFIFMLINILH